MLDELNYFLSECQKKPQIAAIQSRFPELKGIRSVPADSYTDIFKQIDIKADNDFSGGVANFQLKCRTNATDDICFKVKELFGKEKNGIGFAYTVDDTTTYYVFEPNFTNSDYYVFIRGDNTPLIMPTTAIIRAFYRHREFTFDQLTIKDANDSIDCSLRLLFINPQYLVQLLITDFIITLGGNELLTAYADLPLKKLTLN